MSSTGLALVPATGLAAPSVVPPAWGDPAEQLAADPEVVQLTAALRPQFLQDVIVVTGELSVLGSPGCLVPGCKRASHNRQLCRSHYHRWRTVKIDAKTADPAANPAASEADDITSWAALQTPRGVGATPLSACRVNGCRQGCAGNGLCQVHYASWRSASCPHIEPWVKTRRPVGNSNPTCAVPGCELLTDSTRGLYCLSHRKRWHDQGRPETGEFLAHISHYGEDRFDLRRFPLLLRRQVQYGLQGRADDNEIITKPKLLQPLLAVLERRGASSLRDVAVEDLIADLRAVSNRTNSGSIGFLRFALRRTLDLQEGTGWDNEYPRDVWHLRRLDVAARGITTRGIGGMIFRFDRIDRSGYAS